MSESQKPLLVRASDREKMPEQAFSHPFNPKSEIHGCSLGDLVGLQRVGIHLIRIPPDKESFVAHRHHCEEEFIYVLSGRGMALIDEQEYEVGPGDFMGFPAPSVTHHMRNPFGEELVYLAGGERLDAEVADFPNQAKRLVRVGFQVSIHPIGSEEGFPGVPMLPRPPSK